MPGLPPIICLCTLEDFYSLIKAIVALCRVEDKVSFVKEAITCVYENENFIQPSLEIRDKFMHISGSHILDSEVFLYWRHICLVVTIAKNKGVSEDAWNNVVI